MTDFLTRVAQRALGVAPVVQPVMGSRYAPIPDLSVSAIIPAEDSPTENPAKRTPDLERLSADGSASGQINRRAPSVDAVETAAGPFEASASPAQTYLNIQSLSGSEQDALAKPAENTQIRTKPSGEGLQQSATPRIGEPSAAHAERQQPRAPINDVKVIAHHANRADHSGAIVPREDDSFDLSEAELRGEETESAPMLSLSRPVAAIPEGMIPEGMIPEGMIPEGMIPEGMIPESRIPEPAIPEPTIYAKPASHHGRDPVHSQAIAPHEEERFEANDSRPHARERERSAPSTPPFSSEALDREGSPKKRLEQNGRSDRFSTPLRSDASLVNQSTARGADQQLLSSKDVGDAHASSEKIIRVTIGRIDVRTVAPPLPPVDPPAPPEPKLSLDEFLRQHNGRRR